MVTTILRYPTLVPAMSNPVFLSYRHESDAHRAQVRDLAERLERAGLTVVLDQFAQERQFHGGGPNQGWPRWSKQQAGEAAHRILIIASAGWFRCYEGKEVPGEGLGAAAEAGVIEQRLVNAAGVSADVRIVSFLPLDPRALPLDLQRYHRFADPGDFPALLHWLTGVAPNVEAPVAFAERPETAPKQALSQGPQRPTTVPRSSRQEHARDHRRGRDNRARAKAKARSQETWCINNLKQIGLGLHTYALDHEDKLPPDFQSMRDELITTRVLVCPLDPGGLPPSRQSWEDFDFENSSYEYLKPGIGLTDDPPTTPVVRCRFHRQHVLMLHGGVQDGEA